MEEVRVKLGERSYSICIGSGILDEIGKRAARFEFTPRTVIISNPTVYGLYGDRVKNSLSKEGFDVHAILIPDGEQFKDFMWVYYLLSELLKKKLDRQSVIIALGGGVIGDIACFAASIYMRGISCIQVPTTLLSQVDSSVGGKTGVNHYVGKNMIGTFYQPSLVWIDGETLNTLPKREILAGLSEIIKYGVIRDPELYEFLLTKKDPVLSLDKESIAHIIKRSCEIKADVVSEDERESGIRAILNFGHTIGHAIETLTGYGRFLHGEAVAMGMCYETELARTVGLADKKTVETVCGIIKGYGFPHRIPADIRDSAIIDAMQIDKKAVSGNLRFVLPEKIGSVRIVKDIDVDSIRSTLAFQR